MKQLNPNILFTFMFLFISFSALAADSLATRQAHWQQRVEYEIWAELDTISHLLNGYEELVYINNSPQALSEIFIHLWPNAYKDKNSAYALQNAKNGKLDFYQSKPQQRGFIDSLDFKVDGDLVPVVYPEEFNGEVAILKLKTPLPSGAKLTITTPFRVKLPAIFSRAGHQDGHYSITQWYPKPAVFDVNGWNPMSYLDQGEFYSEFGSFKVHVKVPENMIVAATGRLQDAELYERLKDNWSARPALSNDPDRYRTWNYEQDSIHDFAWFASTQFKIHHDTCVVAGKTIDLFLYTPVSGSQENRMKALKESVKFYSKEVAPYPYTHCSVVHGELIAGGGMEYPMICIVGYLDDEVIVHEVGHNWFYGIFGTNERQYPWMDESINSFYEGWFMKQKQLKSSFSLEGVKFIQPTFSDDAELFERQAIAQNKQMAINSHSEAFYSNTYYSHIYKRGAIYYKLLWNYLSPEMMRKVMRDFYRDWGFKHPLPGDLEASIYNTTNVDLSWFFDQMIESNQRVDVKVTSVGENWANFKLKSDTSVFVQWAFVDDEELEFLSSHYSLKDWEKKGIICGQIRAQTGDNMLSVPPEAKGKKWFVVDPMNLTGDANIHNNWMRPNATFKKMEPIKIGIGSGPFDPIRNQVFVLPALAFNAYNGFGLGVMVHNRSVIKRPFEFAITPLYAFKSNSLMGAGKVEQTLKLNSRFLPSFSLGVEGRRVADAPKRGGGFAGINKWSPFVQFNLATRSDIKVNTSKLRISYVGVDNYNGAGLKQNSVLNYRAAILEYHGNWRVNYSDISLNPELEFGNLPGSTLNSFGDFVKLNFTGKYKWNYPVKNKQLRIRLFAGVFLKQTPINIYNYRIGSNIGSLDYRYEQALFDRNVSGNLFRNQVLEREDYLKLPGIPLATTGRFIQNSWISAVNMEFCLPIKKVPIEIFSDVVTGNAQFNNNLAQPAILNVTGLQFNYKGIVKVHVPIYVSSVLDQSLTLAGFDQFHERITFTLNLHNLNLFKRPDFIIFNL